MTTRFLLDANVLIALTVAEHAHHERASAWFAGVQQAAVCPIVEGALLRFLVRLGVPPSSVRAMLLALHEDPRIELWSESLSYTEVELGHVIGHRQVTDAYLAALARHHRGRLATLDEALHAALPESTLLVPR
ncbi:MULTISPECIES: TA system VapC family ribonuclease toxin [Agromyces]|jgi:toxin-antitoxin system PIN domain toxin|uniref:TA system VapC family ribonuclease toxin n=1 Tax=Agromyces TaxID=33877 RepID=UPI001E2EE77F|nr:MULTISPECIES: TA system VapC family ribonuclease toxin [Agromyces]MCD1572851.1 PIN domain-containing protein [Agromyces mediolanus]GLU91186.1 ribonuclease VapC [Agromyces sp. NBRC 114283]